MEHNWPYDGRQLRGVVCWLRCDGGGWAVEAAGIFADHNDLPRDIAPRMSSQKMFDFQVLGHTSPPLPPAISSPLAPKSRTAPAPPSNAHVRPSRRDDAKRQDAKLRMHRLVLPTKGGLVRLRQPLP